MKRALFTLLLVVAVAIPASAQQITIDLPGLDDRASEVVDVTLDGNVDVTSLVQKLDEIVQQMHADGTLTALSMKWYKTDLTVQQGA